MTLSVSLGPQHRWFSGRESHTMRVDCCHLCVHNAFWLDVVCLSVYHKRTALALRPTVNRINGLGGCQRFSQLTVHLTVGISRSSYSRLQQAQSARLATRSTYAAATPSATLLSFFRLTRSARPVQRCTAIAMAFTK